MEFKKNVLLEIVLSIIGVFISVVSIVLVEVAAKMFNTDSSPVCLAIGELVLFVLLLSALSVKKPVFTKVICFIAIGSLLLAAFITSIACSVSFQLYAISFDTIGFLTVSILTLVAMILFLIYYIAGKKDMLLKLSKIANIFAMVFFGLLGVVTVLSSFMGIHQNVPLFGINLAILCFNCVLLLGVILALQSNLLPKEENK